MKKPDIPPDAAWVLIAAAGIGYEVLTVSRAQWDRTASQTTRRWFRTHHPIGRAVFITGWLGFALWYARHIVNGGGAHQ